MQVQEGCPAEGVQVYLCDLQGRSRFKEEVVVAGNPPEDRGKHRTAAWSRSEGKDPEGGLNEKGRESYERQHPGSDLKPPVKKEQASKSKKSAARRKSFCARMEGMKEHNTSSKTANDPDSRINKSLRAWDC